MFKLFFLKPIELLLKILGGRIFIDKIIKILNYQFT